MTGETKDSESGFWTSSEPGKSQCRVRTKNSPQVLAGWAEGCWTTADLWTAPPKVSGPLGECSRITTVIGSYFPL